MKFRLKIAGAIPATVYRVEVANGESCAAAVIAAVPALSDTAPADLQLSLNGKTRLEGDAASTATQLGCCSGDTLWVLNHPAGRSGALAAAVLAPAAPRPAVYLSPPAAEPFAAQPLPRAAPGAAAGAAALQRALASSVSESVPMAVDDAAASKRSRPDNAAAPTPPSAASPVVATGASPMEVEQAPPLPGSGSSASAADGGSGAAGRASAAPLGADDSFGGPEDVVDAEAASGPAKGPLAPDFLSRVLAANGGAPGSAHRLLLLAAHAAMLETGLVPLAAGQGGAQYELPAQSPGTTRGRYQLAYTPSVLLPSAADASSDSSSAVPPAGSAEQGSTSGEAAGSAERAASPHHPTCALSAVEMGPHLVLHAVVTAPGGGSGGAGGTAVAPRSSAASLTLDARQYVRPEAMWQAQTTPASYACLPALWVALKDRLALFMLCHACAHAGVAPPVGLLAMPFEIKHAVLQHLQARDLSAVSSVCSELRHLASDDDLWRAAYTAQFPGALSLTERAVAQQRGWKAAFGSKVVASKRRFEAMRRAMQAPPPLRPSPIAPGGPGLYRPTVPPFVIGGDYDRLPAPGMFPGGMRGGGGMLPGGGGGMLGGGFNGGGPMFGGGGGGGMFGGGGVPPGGGFNGGGPMSGGGSGGMFGGGGGPPGGGGGGGGMFGSGRGGGDPFMGAGGPQPGGGGGPGGLGGRGPAFAPPGWGPRQPPSRAQGPTRGNA